MSYESAWAQMQAFTDERGEQTPDEIWWVEHEPVYTVGRNGHGQPTRSDIPVIHTDRGGDITYHGPGQLVLYVLADLPRLGIGVRALVDHLEGAVIDTLAGLEIAATRRPGAPGVYVGQRKIAALGLRVRRHCSYHGVALNVAMDLTPFDSIVACGLHGVSVAQVAEWVPRATLAATGEQCLGALVHRLYGYPDGQ